MRSHVVRASVLPFPARWELSRSLHRGVRKGQDAVRGMMRYGPHELVCHCMFRTSSADCGLLSRDELCVGCNAWEASAGPVYFNVEVVQAGSFVCEEGSEFEKVTCGGHQHEEHCMWPLRHSIHVSSLGVLRVCTAMDVRGSSSNHCAY